MGLLKPTERPDQPSTQEIKDLLEWAKLPSSGAAGLIQIVGIVLILGGLAGLTTSVPLGASVLVAGGLTIAAGHLQQSIFDIRTLMLRAAKSQTSQSKGAENAREAAK